MGSTCSMVLIRVRPFLFARTMMTFNKILRITEHPCRADQSAIIGINLRTSPSTSVGARAMGSGGGGPHDSVGEICRDVRTRRTGSVQMEQKERKKKEKQEYASSSR